MTIEYLFDLLEQLPTDINLHYSSGRGSAQFVAVDRVSNSIKAFRVKDNAREMVTISEIQISRVLKLCLENKPFSVDVALNNSGNARSVLEALLLHTAEFWKTKIAGNKYVVWMPNNKHIVGEIKDISPSDLDVSNLNQQVFDYNNFPVLIEQAYNSASDEDKENIVSAIKCFLNSIVSSSQPLSSLDPATLTSFNQQLLTAIRTKPFVLLAGISGTGKSRIVRELARACWPEEENKEQRDKQEPKNFSMIQVRPNWHDSTELIGYVSRIKGDRYIPGEFLKFVAKAWQDPERPYFLCLDEMNLAPVEQYFAEYLSIVESRKYDNDKGLVVTDSLVIFDKKSDGSYTDCYQNLYDELFGNCPDGSKIFINEHIKDGISIPQNLVVIGTVNMDETTYSFSRKVLDRAMTLEMNEVDMWAGLGDDNKSFDFGDISKLLSVSVNDEKTAYKNEKDLCEAILAYLDEVNEKLNGTPFKIAYRTRNEFLMYGVNRKSLAKEGEDVFVKTIDEMTSMKILSRIEGDFEKTGNVLDAIKKILETKGLTKDNSISLRKIEEMEKKLKSGYTSYWA